MRRGERWYLCLLLFFSLIAFLPWWREIYLAGMAVFGWLMAALMVFSPAIALVVFLFEKKTEKDNPR
jgi:hypothetical protein